MKASRRILEPSGLELIEEAVHLLRSAPAATLAIYYAGAVPFVLGLLFFWAHTTWFQPSLAQVAWSALGLVGLFATMKATQAEFCGRLLAARLGAPEPEWSWRRFGRVMLAQLRLQSWTLPALPIAVLLTVPFGWLYAYGQNLVVLGDEPDLHDEAVAQAKLWPGQNHVGLLVISILAVVVWVNLGAAFLAVPWLPNRLLGIENIFGVSGWWFFNSTFVASVTVLTWLALDPLVKAFYTLRVFHGRARRSGEDVRVELQLARRSGAAWRAAASVVVLLALPLVAVRAADSPRVPPAAVQPAQLDRTIEDVLSGPDFRWRLRPAVREAARAEDGPVKQFVRQGFDLLAEALRSVGRMGKSAYDWLERHFTGGQEEPAKSRVNGGAIALSVLRFLLYAFIAVAVVLLLWVIWLMARQAARHRAPVLAAQAVAVAAPDLRDENVQAAQLPADGWIALAREQAARGAWRLALRALYLATLARLAAEGLVSLANFKTNLDYEREVRRRALSRAEIVAGFAARRREFEDVWYGRAEPGEGQVRAWMAELEGPALP
ncbi:MAG: hypothetical protein EXS37_00030 [Opitutus sp.]|nr:hypothetical protein [Opitutus sp.]